MRYDDKFSAIEYEIARSFNNDSQGKHYRFYVNSMKWYVTYSRSSSAVTTHDWITELQVMRSLAEFVKKTINDPDFVAMWHEVPPAPATFDQFTSEFADRLLGSYESLKNLTRLARMTCATEYLPNGL